MSGTGLNSDYISSIDLEPYFVSNQNGEANAGGVVTFYKDNNRTEKKSVYQLSKDATTGVYSYVALPNPITLSSIGTFQNSGGDNIAVYYYPYDEFGNEELYYITVYDAYGNLQFTREAWPFPQSGGTASSSAVGFTNQLTNPCFTEVNFIPASTLTVTISGAGTTTVPIAADWDLTIVATGASTVTVTQTPVTGQTALPFNPPYTLDFVIGSNITSCQLIQTLSNNPDWAAPQTTGVMGYLAGSILLGNGTSVNMQYKPSAGNAAQSIINTTNTTGAYAQKTGTIQLAAAANTQTGAVGYDQIIIDILNIPGNASISNVQVVPSTTDISGIEYDQTPSNRQMDHMFNYYNDLLQAKPITSYLEGWCFPLNPAQFLGKTVAASAIGANKSKYVWDQTIIFQSADSGVGVTQNSTGGLVLTAAATTQMAVIQYQEGLYAREILNNRLSVMVSAYASVATIATISLWYTTDVSLPNINSGSNNSLVLTLDANGKPATFNGTWVEIPRNGTGSTGGTTSLLGDAKFTIGTSSTLNYNRYGFNGWNLDGVSGVGTATFFAIVVGTAEVATPNTVSIESISLVPGDIPTIPAPIPYAQSIAACQRYYEKSFNIETVPANAVGVLSCEFTFNQAVAASNNQTTPSIAYKVQKRTLPTITLYNPANNNSQAYNEQVTADYSNTAVRSTCTWGFSVSATTPGGSASGQTSGINWVADARLGII